MRGSYNWGIAVLKIVAAYWVVCNHFGAHPAWSWMCGYAVPVFMMLAFMLGRRLWESNEPSILVERVKRLAIPFVAWSLLYWCVSILTGGGGIKALIGQLVFGHTVCVPLYFYVLLIWFTVLIWFAKKAVLSERSRWSVGFAILIGCLMLQYSGMNVSLIGGMPAFLSSGRFPLGRIAELLPAAIVGLVLSKFISEERTKVCWGVLAMLGVIAFIASFFFKGWLCPSDGFYYQGLHLLLGSTGLVVSAVSLGKGVRLPEGCSSAIKFIAEPLMGVYCVHMFVGRFFPLEWHSASLSLLIFCLSFVLAKGLSQSRFKNLVL